MCWALIPNEMPADVQLKYFKYLIATELNPLQSEGVRGPDGPVKVKIFGASLDLKGKEKFYNQVVVTGYCGCSTCCIHYDRGYGGAIYAASRRQLPADHPLRNITATVEGVQFFFRNRETRIPPPVKSTQTLFKYATLAKLRGVTHYLGQKGEPMFASLKGFRYAKFNFLEWMHNIARAFDRAQDYLVGGSKNFDKRCRDSSRSLGLFKEIWEMQYLPQPRADALSRLQDDTISSGNVTWCRHWLRVCDVQLPPNTRVLRQLRERVESLRDMALRGERIPLVNVQGPMPWRLTSRAQEIVNRRVVRISYPHDTPICSLGSQSFIKKAGCWRSASKLTAFLVILVPALRGYVKELRTAFRSLIHGLRLLEGQTYSVNEADALGLNRGHKALSVSEIRRSRTLILEGLAMIEGSVPVCCQVPAFHCLSHYSDGAAMHGILRLYWMMSFGNDALLMNQMRACILL